MRSRNGFTMIEMVVAVAILAVVVAATYRVFSYSTGAFEKNISRNETMQTGQNIINLLKRDFSAISMEFKSNSMEISVSDFIKVIERPLNKTIYRFYSLAEAGMKNNELENKLDLIEYCYDEPKKTLTRTIYYNSTRSSFASKKRVKVLSKSVDRFEISTPVGEGYGIRKSFIRPFFVLIEQSKKIKTKVPREFMATIIPESLNSMLTFGSYNRNFNTDAEY